jgi:hypothetical protein
MSINRHYSEILRALRSVEMRDHERRAAHQEARRAVLIIELLAGAIGGRDFGGGHRISKSAVRLRAISRTGRRAHAVPQV